MADPDFELRRGPGFILLAQPTFFSTKIWGPSPPGPSPRSATAGCCWEVIFGSCLGRVLVAVAVVEGKLIPRAFPPGKRTPERGGVES